MSRELTKLLNHKAALLATGDEITNGDILNSNTQLIAQKLFRQGIPIGMHMSVSDNTAQIKEAIHLLLQNHRILVITGGLGPTSDDLTRYALSENLSLPLIFKADIWEQICERFKLLGYSPPPPHGNRQQALFPEIAKIIPNPSGTAAGCLVEWEEKFIFMLPGPPSECLPMIDDFVVPFLISQHCNETFFYNSWLLFGVSEGAIAEQLDQLAKPYNCITGYRLAYPYIEFKIYSNQEDDFKKLNNLVEIAVAPYLISDGKKTAAQMLQKQLEKLTHPLRIHDTATGGLLQTSLVTPENHKNIDFSNNEPTIHIEGLKAFWENKEDSDTDLALTFARNGRKERIEKKIPLRGRKARVRQFAVEYICFQISKFIKQ